MEEKVEPRNLSRYTFVIMACPEPNSHNLLLLGALFARHTRLIPGNVHQRCAAEKLVSLTPRANRMPGKLYRRRRRDTSRRTEIPQVWSRRLPISRLPLHHQRKKNANQPLCAIQQIRNRRTHRHVYSNQSQPRFVIRAAVLTRKRFCGPRRVESCELLLLS